MSTHICQKCGTLWHFDTNLSCPKCAGAEQSAFAERLCEQLNEQKRRLSRYDEAVAMLREASAACRDASYADLFVKCAAHSEEVKDFNVEALQERLRVCARLHHRAEAFLSTEPAAPPKPEAGG